MKITGIVCEYNPFHNGHIYHIQKTREITQCDLLIAVMSGNFVQRGEPAIINKWQRAETAIKHGVDLVIELPFIYATQSASYFAQGAMHILKQMGCDSFCFGSESNDLDQLRYYAKKEPILLDKTMSPVKSYELAYGVMDPNDILGINYLRFSDNMTPYCIKRTNHYFDSELENEISSATSIRKAISNHENVEKATPMILTEPVYLSDFYPLIQTLLLTLSLDYLKTIFLMDEGIENLLKKNASYATFEEFMSHSISKKYTKGRIQRTLIHLINQTLKEQVNHLDFPQCVRVLAANKKGKAYLKQAPCKVALRFRQMEKEYRDMEYKATAVYASVMNENKKAACKERELQPPILL